MGEWLKRVSIIAAATGAMTVMLTGCGEALSGQVDELTDQVNTVVQDSISGSVCNSINSALEVGGVALAPTGGEENSFASLNGIAKDLYTVAGERLIKEGLPGVENPQAVGEYLALIGSGYQTSGASPEEVEKISQQIEDLYSAHYDDISAVVTTCFNETQQ